MTPKRPGNRDLHAELAYHRRRVAALEAALHGTSSSRLRAVTDDDDGAPAESVELPSFKEGALDKADSASHAKDEFLSAMSHELRTPLNAILGACEALREGVYGPVPEAQNTIVHRVEESGQRLLAVVDAVLDFSALSTGSVKLAQRLTPIDELCRASLADVRDAAQRKGLRVAFEITDGFLQAAVDPTRFVQALANLMANAVKFTPQGGAIGLVAAGDTANGRARFSVWDTGIGIADGDVARLFRPFVQLDAGLARRHGGTGLGLAIAYQLVELHGGSLTVATTPGNGSRFTIDIPLRDGGAPHAPGRDG